MRICHFEGKKHSAKIMEIPEQALPARRGRMGSLGL